MTHHIRPLAALALAVALAGCASSPPEHFYSLSNGMGATPSTTATAPAPYYIEVSAVTVPQQVARNQLVVTTGAGRMDLLEQERWTSPPAAEIGQALSLAISGELGTVDAFRTPTPEGAAVYRISTHTCTNRRTGRAAELLANYGAKNPAS